MNEDQKKYLKAAIMTAVSMAGVGAFIRNWKAKKERKKALDINNGKNTIVIPIVKEDFMRGIPTPEERADEMDGKVVEGAPGNPKGEGAFGKVFNFFRKKASEEEKGDNGKSKSDGVEVPVNEKKVTEEKIDGRLVLRGQDGKFVSPTDPVAVMDVEKTAQMGIVDSLLHPGDFARNVARAFKGHPLWMAGGAVGSIILATKIVDYLAKERRRKADKRLEDARESYVNLLENGEGSEKKAQNDVPGVAGTVLGTAFFLPLALTAMVANKIIENRDAERRRKKSMSNSYPQDPTFVYNVVDGEKIAMSTDRALALMMFKTAMVASCEEKMNEKKAGLTDKAKKFFDDNSISTEGARDAILKLLEDNPNEMLDIIKERAYGNKEKSEERLAGLISGKGGGLGKKLMLSGFAFDPDRKNELENSIYTSPALTKLVADRFTDDKFNGTYGAFADEMIGKRLGLRQGSFLHKIITWLMGLFGVRSDLIKGEVDKKMKEIASPISAERKKFDDIRAMKAKLDGAAQKVEKVREGLGGDKVNTGGNSPKEMLDRSGATLDRAKRRLEATPSPAMFDEQTYVEPIPSNADYEHLSYEDPQALIPGAGPKPGNTHNDGLRIPQEGDALWEKFKNLPEIDGEQYTGTPYQRELVKIQNMGMNQLADNIDYRAGRAVGKPPQGPARKREDVAPQVNSNLIDSELEAMRNSARPELPPANKDPSIPPIGQKQQPMSVVLTR